MRRPTALLVIGGCAVALVPRATFVAEAAAAGEWLVVVDVPLLFETNPDEASLRAAGVDAVLVMSAPEDVQVCHRP